MLLKYKTIWPVASKNSSLPQTIPMSNNVQWHFIPTKHRSSSPSEFPHSVLLFSRRPWHPLWKQFTSAFSKAAAFGYLFQPAVDHLQMEVMTQAPSSASRWAQHLACTKLQFYFICGHWGIKGEMVTDFIFLISYSVFFLPRLFLLLYSLSHPLSAFHLLCPLHIPPASFFSSFHHLLFFPPLLFHSSFLLSLLPLFPVSE